VTFLVAFSIGKINFSLLINFIGIYIGGITMAIDAVSYLDVGEDEGAEKGVAGMYAFDIDD
jgi:hypothetical protein